MGVGGGGGAHRTGGRQAGFSPRLTKFAKGQLRSSRGSAAPGPRPTASPPLVRGHRCLSPWLAASEQASGSQSQAAPCHPASQEGVPEDLLGEGGERQSHLSSQMLEPSVETAGADGGPRARRCAGRGEEALERGVGFPLGRVTQPPSWLLQTAALPACGHVSSQRGRFRKEICLNFYL